MTSEWIQKIKCVIEGNPLLDAFLQNIDPSLLQNVILGILALLVPVGVGILSYFFEERSKGNIEANLELYILLKTVLKADKIAIYSSLNLLLLALFNVNDYFKNVSIIFTIIYLAWIFFVPFKNIWAWFLSNTTKFSAPFLKKLSVIKNAETIVISWKALWLASGKINERDFTSIFIAHIDDAIKFGKFDLAVQLAQVYINNIEKRDRFSIGYEILPKVFDWNETLWNEQQLWLKGYDTEKKIQSFFSQKHFPTFKNWTLKLYKKTKSEKENFWNWHYFGGEFFQAIIKVLLKDGHGPYQLFSSFKKHIDESEKKLDKIEDEKEREKYWHYVTGLFSSFCPTFFKEIDSAPSNYGIWEHDFPPEWKIKITNKDNRIARVILHEFLQWSRDRIFKKENDLTEVINGLFPNVHSSLFTAFLMLFFSSEVKYALEKEPNFYILGVSVSWSGSIEESEEERNKRLAEMMEAEDISQKEETVQIILKFFHFWQTFAIKDNLSEDETKNWESYLEEQRKLIVIKVRKVKLEKIKQEIESEEIKKICEDSKQKELRRKDFLELIELLMVKVSK
jgi:hypothetical protein